MKKIQLDTKNYPQNQKNINVRKVKNVLGIDTETIMDLENAMPFDIGYIVYDNQNDKILNNGTCLIRKFVNNKYVMLSSWSANKYQLHYKPMLATKQKNVYVSSVKAIAQRFENIIKKYNIKYMFAHNGQFDYVALNRLFEDNGIESPFKKLDIIDTMMLSYSTITKTKEYQDFCINTKNITDGGRVKTTAESITKFLLQDTDFMENHTGLEDIKIELEIFKHCKNKKAIFPINAKPSWKNFEKIA